MLDQPSRQINALICLSKTLNKKKHEEYNQKQQQKCKQKSVVIYGVEIVNLKQFPTPRKLLECLL